MPTSSRRHWRGNPFPLCGVVRAPRPTSCAVTLRRGRRPRRPVSRGLILPCRGGQLCPPCMTVAPCRAGPVCPAVTGEGIRLSSPPSAREVSARSADGGRDATRFLSLPQSAAPTAPSQRGSNSAAPPRCHCKEHPKGTCFAARSAVAIRPPSTNLRQNHNNSQPNFVHLSKIWKFRRKRLRRGRRSAIF